MARTVAAAIIERKFGSVSRKAVASVLGEHASVTDDGEWWTIVGQKRIAAEAEVSERTVRTILTSFEGEGLISRLRRHRKDGTRTSDRILIYEDEVRALPEALSASQPEGVAGGGQATTGNSEQGLPATDDRPTGKAVAAQEPSEDPSVEPSDSDLLPTVVDHAAEPKNSGRPRDEIWDTLEAVFEPVTNTNTRGRRNKAVKLLRESGATPDEIRFRVSAWPLHFPNATLTDIALANHWDELGRQPARASEADSSEIELARRRQQRRRQAEELEAERRGLPE